MSNRYENWQEKAEKHNLNHTTAKRNGQKDFSCTICHQPSEIMRKEFKRFWKWYKEEIPEVRSYSGETEENFEELMKEDFSVKERTETEKAKIIAENKELLKRLVAYRAYFKVAPAGMHHGN